MFKDADLVILCASILFATIIVIIVQIYNKKIKNTVLNNSRAILSLKELNLKYEELFDKDLKYSYYFYIDCDYLQQFKVCNEHKALYNISELNKSLFYDIDIRTNKNNAIFEEYENKYNSISSFLTKEDCDYLKINYSKSHEFELRYFKENFLNTSTEPVVVIEVNYVSAGGNSKHQKKYVYTWNQVRDQIKIVQFNEKFKTTKEYQRSMLNNSLRYDVLKRDNFRCVICGRTAADGIKLHVDHIIPVSKGGKTEFNNLRTLCDECNLGKSDKYSETDIN